MRDDRSIFEDVMELSAAAGFDAAGVAAVPEPGSDEDYKELRHVEPWVAADRAGEMEYLKRRNEAGVLLRSSLRVAIPWARSVIVCAANYNTAAPRSIDPADEDRGWIARYAWTGRRDEKGELLPSDYHKVLLRRLQSVEAGVRATLRNRADAHAAEFQSRCYVDTGPLVERVYAKHAGIGWIGKNTCVLNERLGSWLFLGVIITSLDPEHWLLPLRSAPPDAAGQAQTRTAPHNPQLPAADRCGSCTRCLEACPTNALTAPYQMDATLCISYLTIEKRGEIPQPLRTLMGRQVFGCDICQDVCPWNRKAPISTDPQLQTREELVNPSLASLAALDQEGFGKLFYGSPVKRARLSGLHRNVAIAMGNSRLPEFLPRLEEWTTSEDEVLAETAAWAIAQIAEGKSHP